MPVDAMTATVLAVLMRKVSAAEAAVAAGATESEVVDWISRFVEAGAAGLRRPGRPDSGPGRHAALHDPRSATDLHAENRTLREVLRETRSRAEMWRIVARDTPGPLRDLEVIREDAAMPVSKFCYILGIPRRSYFRRLARMRSGENVAGKRRAAPSVQLCAPVILAYTARWPEHGHRRIHAQMLKDGHVTSPSTVLRAMRPLRRSGRGADGEPSETATDPNQIPGATLADAHGEHVPVSPQV